MVRLVSTVKFRCRRGPQFRGMTVLLLLLQRKTQKAKRKIQKFIFVCKCPSNKLTVPTQVSKHCCTVAWGHWGILDPWPDPTQILRRKFYATLTFENSDWLLKFFNQSEWYQSQCRIKSMLRFLYWTEPWKDFINPPPTTPPPPRTPLIKAFKMGQ